MVFTDQARSWLRKAKNHAHNAFDHFSHKVGGEKQAAALIVVIVLLIVLGSSTLLSPPDAGQLPVFEAVIGGTTVSGVEGSYCWNTGGNGRCVDKIDPTELMNAPGLQTAYITIPASVHIRTLNHTAPAVYTYAVYAENGEVVQRGTVGSGRFKLDLPEGQYMLSVSGDWPHGDMSYYFRLDAE